MSSEDKPMEFILTCDDETARYALSAAGARERIFHSVEEALDYLQNTSKGARVMAVTLAGQTLFDTIV
jgi:phage gp36-like protein